MFFKKQVVLQRQQPLVKTLFSTYQWDAEKIENLAPLIDHFEIRIPFIGAFSSGKSTLINALIEEPLLSTAITAETAVAAEIRYGATRRFVGKMGDGKTIDLSENEVTENRLSMLLPKGYLCVEIPAPALAANPHLVLVDMPGWGSGVAAHELVIDDYADRSLAYAVVVSVDEGTLRETLRKALLELAVQEKPVILILTKAHKKPAADAALVAKALIGEITQLMGKPPLAVALTSASKAEIDELKNALKLLNARAEGVFEASVVSPWRSELERAGNLAQVLSNDTFKDAALITAEIESFEQQMQAFDARLVSETEGLEARVGPMLASIRIRVESALHGRVDSLTDRALSGGNISDDILGTARLVISQALKEEFEPSMLRYLDRLVDALPSKLDFKLSLSPIKTESGNPSEFRWKGLSLTLAPLLLKIPHPLAKIAAVILPILGFLFDNKADQQRQELEEARQRERVKSQVRSALSGAAAQIEAELRPVMDAQIQKAKEAVAKNIAIERGDIEKTLIAKRSALEEGEEKATLQRKKAAADLQIIEGFLAEI